MSSYGSLDRLSKLAPSGEEGDGVKNDHSPAQSPAEYVLPLIIDKHNKKKDSSSSSGASKKGGQNQYTILHCIIYAFINVIIAVPGLYGYASVIFNHPSFQPEIAKLSKLVVFSSFVHQLGFLLFSTLDFAIGTVQESFH